MVYRDFAILEERPEPFHMLYKKIVKSKRRKRAERRHFISIIKISAYVVFMGMMLMISS
jgi:hypothetical protein